MGIFFTADLHFFHKKVLEYEQRPFANVEEMNQALMDRWNRKVKVKDSVYILGDLSFGKKEETISIVKSLKGVKYLVKGNHDLKLVKYAEIESLFGWVKDYHHLKYNKLRIILFHYPIAVWDSKHYGALHLYGHLHKNLETHHPLQAELRNAFNVGVDVNNYEPVSLAEIMQKAGLPDENG